MAFNVRALDKLPVFQKTLRVIPKSGLFFFGVYKVGTHSIPGRVRAQIDRHPCWMADVVDDPGSLRLQRRHDLDPRGAITDDSDLFVGPVVGRIPTRCVEELALKPVQTFNRGHLPPIEDASGIDENICFIVDSCIVLVELEDPFTPFLVPNRLDKSGVEDDLLLQPVLLSCRSDVFLDFRALGIALRPGRIGLKGKYITVSRHVAAHTRVDVLKPSTPYLGILFIDGEVNKIKRLLVLELVCKDQSRKARSNADDSEFSRSESKSLGIYSICCGFRRNGLSGWHGDGKEILKFARGVADTQVRSHNSQDLETGDIVTNYMISSQSFVFRFSPGRSLIVSGTKGRSKLVVTLMGKSTSPIDSQDDKLAPNPFSESTNTVRRKR